ncbi:uncharacterized protein LOC113110138 [Carassius auratus]|uniref:Uncharacterized protein LOC113110138 n=1 Tax=Carassius auratus TaxID=7957 RepID=A0A6P6Q920_CARAU|nr:uncharacterized protein LOC113110138 [Carassius auratus]
MLSSSVQSSAADAPQTPHRNKSIGAAHPAIYLNTRSHKLLRRAIRIWKMPIPILNLTGSLKPKPRSFREQLKRVEMLRNRSEDSMIRKPMTRCVRDLQLCSSGTDSSPSPSSTSLTSRRSLRTRPVHAHRSRRYRRQLQLYRMLSNIRRRRRSREGQSSPAESSCVKGSSEIQDDGRDSSSTQNPPVIRPPPRKTSRRLWRRQLDSSSSDNSPMTANTAHRPRPATTDTHTHNTSSFSFADVSSESAEFDFSDIDSSAIQEAHAHRNINIHDPPDEESTHKPLKITEANTDEQEKPDTASAHSLVSRLKTFKDDLKHCEDAPEMKQESVQFKSPSSVRNTQSTADALQKPDTPRPKSSVKWKNVMMQRALCSFTFPSEDQDPTHESWSRPTLEDDSRDSERADVTPESPEKPAEDNVKNRAAGDACIPQENSS